MYGLIGSVTVLLVSMILLVIVSRIAFKRRIIPLEQTRPFSTTTTTTTTTATVTTHKDQTLSARDKQYATKLNVIKVNKQSPLEDETGVWLMLITLEHTKIHIDSFKLIFD